LKTSAGTICGTRAYYAADTLEQQARAGDKDGIATAAALLQRELDSLNMSVKRFLAARDSLNRRTAPALTQSGAHRLATAASSV
jgi:hypothetical protein